MTHIEIAGENASIVYFGERADPAVAAQVQAACARIEAVLGDTLIDLIPSYASILVIYDPALTDHLLVNSLLRTTLSQQESAPDSVGRIVKLPVYYSEESGPDLANLAAASGIDLEQVIQIHSQTLYRVYAIGFAPGFAYMGEVDARIAAPRLSTPRTRVPTGSVAIADRQTAVYPAPSPGGWNLIGRCPIRMFNPAADPIMPVTTGDQVQFEPITKQQFFDLGGTL